jgi:hypothetical protein
LEVAGNGESVIMGAGFGSCKMKSSVHGWW